MTFDEYHFGAWRDSAKELFEGEDPEVAKKELALEFAPELDKFDEEMLEPSEQETDFLPITSRAYLYLSGTPFRALATGEFIEEQIFNWTYTDEQRAKHEFEDAHPGEWNPYAALPEMRLFTYRMPDDLITVANQGEFDEFDLNAFFEASGTGANADFAHKDDVQKWLDIIRGAYLPTQIDALRTGTRPPMPTRTCACCATCSTRSGCCQAWPRARRWPTCSPSPRTSTGMPTRSWWWPDLLPASASRHCLRCERLMAKALSRRR